MSDSAAEILILPPTTKRLKLDESENEDRLNDLPESVILHILSFLNTKIAVQTCVLSTRWKDLWKRIPAATLHSSNSRACKKFTKLVSKVLSLRDSSISLQTLDYRGVHGNFEADVKRIVNYALSHNVQRLVLFINGDIAQIPPSMFSCQTLTFLKLSIYHGDHETLFPKSLNLPALTNLQLGNFTFGVDDNDRAEPFSKFNRLNSLLICNCTVTNALTLCISSVTLVDLTIYNHKYNFYNIDLCTPNLCKLVFAGTPYQRLSGSNVSSLKHLDIDAAISPYKEEPPLILLSWLLELAEIKSLTVTPAALQVLYFIPNLLKFNLPSLHNLKLLKLRMEEIFYGFRMTLRDTKLLTAKSKREAARIRKAFKDGLELYHIPDGVVEFLLQNSPLAQVEFTVRRPYKEKRI
ncbi:FBD-associated F-box protein At1g66310-like [Vicia villosa]|uniref:FBD-associated F-box protein At1g66310-like n=1 Tax=Vicia villosa TaxID=3911 RepID=UPI00273AA272|nr:FBD-associated F-box protein At1g66310-like [Vicia villosa]